MTKHALFRALLLLAPLLALSAPAADAQSRKGAAPDDELYRTVAALDTALFDAVHRCDLEKVASLFADDTEFYHDKGGVTRSGKAVVDSIRDNLCGKVRRELVPGTLEVYPMEGYGAVEIGVHRFYELKGPHPNEPSGEAKFIHLWQLKDGAWKITRVISYDHGPAPAPAK